MHKILECSPIAQFSLGQNHTITFWNKACEILTGFSAVEMIGTQRQWEPFYLVKRPVLGDLSTFDFGREMLTKKSGTIEYIFKDIDKIVSFNGRNFCHDESKCR